MKEKDKIDLIKTNKAKINKFISDLPEIIDEIFEKEKDLSLKFMNISLNEY